MRLLPILVEFMKYGLSIIGWNVESFYMITKLSIRTYLSHNLITFLQNYMISTLSQIYNLLTIGALFEITVLKYVIVLIYSKKNI